MDSPPRPRFLKVDDSTIVRYVDELIALEENAKKGHLTSDTPALSTEHVDMVPTTPEDVEQALRNHPFPKERGNVQSYVVLGMVCAAIEVNGGGRRKRPKALALICAVPCDVNDGDCSGITLAYISPPTNPQKLKNFNNHGKLASIKEIGDCCVVLFKVLIFKVKNNAPEPAEWETLTRRDETLWENQVVTPWRLALGQGVAATTLPKIIDSTKSALLTRHTAEFCLSLDRNYWHDQQKDGKRNNKRTRGMKKGRAVIDQTAIEMNAQRALDWFSLATSRDKFFSRVPGVGTFDFTPAQLAAISTELKEALDRETYCAVLCLLMMDASWKLTRDKQALDPTVFQIDPDFVSAGVKLNGKELPNATLPVNEYLAGRMPVLQKRLVAGTIYETKENPVAWNPSWYTREQIGSVRLCKWRTYLSGSGDRKMRPKYRISLSREGDGAPYYVSIKAKSKADYEALINLVTKMSDIVQKFLNVRPPVVVHPHLYLFPYFPSFLPLHLLIPDVDLCSAR